MAMQQRQIHLTDRQVTFLAAEAERVGISIADLIRRIVDQHIEDREKR